MNYIKFDFRIAAVLMTMLMSMSMLSLPVSAQGTPCPVIVTIDPPIYGADVNVRSLDDGTSFVLQTNNNGEVSFNAGSLCGDILEIEFYGIKATAYFKGFGYFEQISFDKSDCPYCNYEPDIILQDPPLPIIVTTTTIAPIVEPIVDPVQDEAFKIGFIEFVLVILATILGTTSTAVYFYVGTDKNGKPYFGSRSHKHYGIKGKHSRYTVHENADIRHPKGEMRPRYKFGAYVPEGDR